MWRVILHRILWCQNLRFCHFFRHFLSFFTNYPNRYWTTITITRCSFLNLNIFKTAHNFSRSIFANLLFLGQLCQITRDCMARPSNGTTVVFSVIEWISGIFVFCHRATFDTLIMYVAFSCHISNSKITDSVLKYYIIFIASQPEIQSQKIMQK